MEEWPDGQRQRQYSPSDGRRQVLTVKPAKLNISEFEGVDPEAWIQNLDQYFVAARTPIEHRTELAVSYLKGPAVQWWRGTGYSPNNVPWHKLCSCQTNLLWSLLVILLAHFMQYIKLPPCQLVLSSLNIR